LEGRSAVEGEVKKTSEAESDAYFSAVRGQPDRRRDIAAESAGGIAPGFG